MQRRTVIGAFTAGLLLIVPACSKSSKQAATTTTAAASSTTSTAPQSTTTASTTTTTAAGGPPSSIAKLTLPSTYTAPTGGYTYVQGGKITDANAWLKDMFAIAAAVPKSNFNQQDVFVPYWQKAYPTVLTDARLNGKTIGYAGVAEPDLFSGDAPVNPKNPPGVADGLLLAVKDDTGRCAGGVLLWDEAHHATAVIADMTGRKCSGSAAAGALNVY